ADAGLRVKSRLLGPEHMANESLRMQSGVDSFVQYSAAVSAMTELDMGDMTAKIVALASNPDLRARLGQGALARAHSTYDWSVVIPQMQALWGEQAARKAAASAKAHRIPGFALPVAPSPSLLFGGYPSETARLGGERFQAPDRSGQPDLAEMLALRNYTALSHIFTQPERIAAVYGAVQGGHDTVAAIAQTTQLPAMMVERTLMWLLKYDFVRRAA
ncbi:MAG: hypothetical protein WCO04_09910, partial [Pseudomonadota bacterium]